MSHQNHILSDTCPQKKKHSERHMASSCIIWNQRNVKQGRTCCFVNTFKLLAAFKTNKALVSGRYNPMWAHPCSAKSPPPRTHITIIVGGRSNDENNDEARGPREEMECHSWLLPSIGAYLESPSIHMLTTPKKVKPSNKYIICFIWSTLAPGFRATHPKDEPMIPVLRD